MLILGFAQIGGILRLKKEYRYMTLLERESYNNGVI